MLYGPPGTGKTTIVESLAGALGWQYIEILASDFLSRGVDAVPARADYIFDHLMQVDRCVVLFDEIDELIRDRTDETSDPFGRFLTTSMLPKLAKLWRQRRIIFFVATNHISNADRAITRSSRFDARIFVSPPGLAVKRKVLESELGCGLQLDTQKVAVAIGVDKERQGDLTEHEHALAVLPLLRYDQLPELARLIRKSMKADRESVDEGPVTAEALLGSLELMGAELLAHDWRPAKSDDERSKLTAVEQLRLIYEEYRVDEGHDSSRTRVVVADSSLARFALELWSELGKDDTQAYYKCSSDLDEPGRDGQIVLGRDSLRGSDRRLLSFLPSKVQAAFTENG